MMGYSLRLIQYINEQRAVHIPKQDKNYIPILGHECTQCGTQHQMRDLPHPIYTLMRLQTTLVAAFIFVDSQRQEIKLYGR